MKLAMGAMMKTPHQSGRPPPIFPSPQAGNGGDGGQLERLGPTCDILRLAGGAMAVRKKMSKGEFTRKFTAIAGEALEKVPPAEQTKRIADFENTVTRIVRGSPSKASRSPQTPATPLHSRTRG